MNIKNQLLNLIIKSKMNYGLSDNKILLFFNKSGNPIKVEMFCADKDRVKVDYFVKNQEPIVGDIQYHEYWTKTDHTEFASTKPEAILNWIK